MHYRKIKTKVTLLTYALWDFGLLPFNILFSNHGCLYGVCMWKYLCTYTHVFSLNTITWCLSMCDFIFIALVFMAALYFTVRTRQDSLNQFLFQQLLLMSILWPSL